MTPNIEKGLVMPIQKYPINLEEHEIHALEKFVASGSKNAREINRARVLLLANKGEKNKKIAELLGITRDAVWYIRKNFCKETERKHILNLLKDKPREGRPIKIDSRVETKMTMIACSDPPEGAAKWTMQMIADKLVKLEVINSISDESVRLSLKKTN